MEVIKNYQLNERDYTQLQMMVFATYPIDRMNENGFDLVRENGHVLLVHPEKRVTLIGFDRSGAKKLLEELIERTGLDVDKLQIRT
ncbi:MAG TPA: hypothetical protein VJ142_00435 [Candidatus Nanoarchaeia archaeon]|nr:hypothetical protein [Candidatus Nanoarchaeia archaeon]